MNEQPLHWNIHELREALFIIRECLTLDESKNEVWINYGIGRDDIALLADGYEASVIIAALNQLHDIKKPASSDKLILVEDKDATIPSYTSKDLICHCETFVGEELICERCGGYLF